MPRWVHTVADGRGVEITERATDLRISGDTCRFSLFAPWCDSTPPEGVAVGAELRIGEDVTMEWQGHIERVELAGPVFQVWATGEPLDDPGYAVLLDRVETDA
jgi:hypothetical protein